MTDLQRSIDRARSFRFAAVCGAVLDAVLIAVDLARGSATAFAPAVLLAGLLVLVVMQTRLIGSMQRTQELNQRAGQLELAAAAVKGRTGRCAHPDAEPVDLSTGERVAWVCANPECNAELPADWTPQAKAPEVRVADHETVLRWHEARIRAAIIAPKPDLGDVRGDLARDLRDLRELEALKRHTPAESEATWDDVAYASEASEHFAALARVGRESCIGFCPICAEGRQKAGAGQATLPAAYRERTIARMEPGRPYYSVPWAMRADEDGRLWLRPGYAALNRPGGTVSMRIERREDGYHVWPVPGKAYAPETFDGQQFIPVAVLEGEL